MGAAENPQQVSNILYMWTVTVRTMVRSNEDVQCQHLKSVNSTTL